MSLPTASAAAQDPWPGGPGCPDPDGTALPPALDRSGFLGGRLQLWQPVAGYRGGIDPVLLAAAVPASGGQSVLELGLGSGTASLCLGARVPGLALTGVEIQPLYAALAGRNAAENGIALEVVQADVGLLPAALKARSFDHVMTNPPFFRAESRSPAADPGRETGRGESLPLADWIAAGLKRLRPGGTLTVIHAAARLAELLAALPSGGTRIRPLAARGGRAADRIILTHRKGGRSELVLEAPLVLHAAERHLRDGEDHAPWATAVLRGGAALP